MAERGTLNAQLNPSYAETDGDIVVTRILVAEDSFALANLLTFVLKNSNFEPEVFSTGDKALEAAQERPFDVVLLDQQMPRMTGLEVAEGIRASGPNQSTPICLCTAKTHELNLDEVRDRLGVSAIFHKPFSPKDLVVDLNKVLDETSVVKE
ncbi:MAG TPA: response regulator [Planctomycetaceae bacterium]|nr:response regulator [Planctomycetaceae bacterium]